MKISVAMCTYNGEHYVEKQIKSIINQTIKVDEIIICDDGSTDNTIEIIKTLGEKYKQIKLYQNKESLKVVKNFIKAYSKCSGEIIFSCDQDDIWENNKVEVIINTFKTNPNIKIIGTNANIIDGSDKKTNQNLFDIVEYNYEENNFLTNYKYLLKQPILTGATMAFKKGLLKNMYESKYALHDYTLSIIASLNDELLMLNENITNYRVHSNNACGIKKISNRDDILNKIKKPYAALDYYNHEYKKYLEVFEFIKQNNIKIKHEKELLECLNFWNNRKNINKITKKELNQFLKYSKRNQLYEKYIPKNPKFTRNLEKTYYLIFRYIKRKGN